MSISTYIRPAEPNDAAALASVHVRTWQHAYRGQIPNAVLDSLSIETRTGKWQAWLSELAEKTSVSVAVSDEAAIGFCWIGPPLDERSAEVNSTPFTF